MGVPRVQEAIQAENYFHDFGEWWRYEQAELATKNRASEIETAVQMGREEMQVENAISFLRMGLNVHIISEGTKLSLDRVEELAREYGYTVNYDKY